VLSGLKGLFGGLSRRRAVEREVREEILFHLEMLADDYKTQGLDPEDAWRAAVRDFGERDSVEIECRRLTTKHERKEFREVVMGGWIQDLRQVLRALRKAPAFAFLTVLTLALGIGANTAIFSVVNGVLLQPLPYGSPDELVLITHAFPEGDISGAPLSGPDFVTYRDAADLFEGVVATFAVDTNITGDGDAEGAVISWVTPNFFDLLRVVPTLGRGFTEDDVVSIDPSIFQDPNATPPSLAAVLSHGIWERRYGGDPSVVGRTLRINGQTVTVIGVAPQWFELHLPADATMPTDIDVWTLWPFELADMRPGPAGFVTVIARLDDNVTVEQSRAQMSAVLASITEGSQAHAQRNTQVEVTPLQAQSVAHIKPILIVLFGTVAFVLLIACANVANLLLVRASTREKEIAIRSALGSGRARIARQMLTEALVLALMGAVAGIALSSVGVNVLLTMMPESLPRADTIALDGSVLAFTLAVSVAAALLFGMAPFIQSSRVNPAGILQERISTGSRKRKRVRATLTVLQVAVSVVLLVGAGLLLRSFSGLAAVDPGFDDNNVLSFRFALPVFEYRTGDMMRDFYLDLSQRLEEIPEVQSAGAVMPMPLADQSEGQVAGYTRNADDAEDFERNEADYRVVLPGYFETLDIPLLAGRLLNDLDEADAAENPVILIDRVMAEQAFPGEDPVGQELSIWAPEDGFQAESGMRQARILGVVEAVRSSDLATLGRPALYLPLGYSPSYRMDYVVKTSAPSAALMTQIRQAVREAGPTVPVLDVRPLSDYSRDALAPTRFAMTLLGVFAIVAMLLACIGLYGVLSYSVRERVHEVGVRMALGAAADGVLRMVIGQGVRLVLIGVALGLGGAFLLSNVMTGLLFGVSATDPLTYVAIAATLVAVAVVACYVPAARAARVQPAMALRSE
jgi:putative ABC transport system permease protein